VFLDLAAQVLHEVIVDSLADVIGRRVPLLLRLSLPGIFIEIGEEGENRVQIPLNCAFAHLGDRFFAKNCQMKVEAMLAVKHKEGVSMFHIGWSGGKPVAALHALFSQQVSLDWL